MDCRDLAMMRTKPELDEKNMKIKLVLEDDEGEEVEHWLPVKFEVCGLCRGKGTCVNPDIDRNGLSREDFDEDPDFAEAYFGGMYDMTCPECGGRRVVSVVDEEKVDKALLKELERREQDEREYAQLCEMERRMGC